MFQFSKYLAKFFLDVAPTFPHSVEFLDAPWWSSALSFGGSEHEVFVNTPTDLTYQFGLSLGFLTRRPIPGAWMLLRADFDSEGSFG